MSALKAKVAELIPKKQAEVQDIKARFGHKTLGKVTVDQAIGGMRDIPAMVYDTSLLDKMEVTHL